MTGTETSVPAAVVDGVSKAFRLPHEQVSTLKERMVHPFRRATFERFDALKDISFAVPRGEFFGIVGRNGSGKSTLLKCLAGIYRIDQGAIYMNGRVSTFIELGVGFNPDLAARDNIVLNGVMLGLTPAAARARCDEVLEFAELTQFEDLKLKNYSSGMSVRLAFSVMVQVEADILLIDEVLAVGDAAFQQKCFDAFNRLRDEGRTIVFVTHDMGSVRRFCDRAMLIERGGIKAIGDPDEVASHYVDLNFAESNVAGEHEHERVPGPAGTAAELLDAWWEDEAGTRQTGLHQGQAATFRVRMRFHETVEDPEISVIFENERKLPLLVTGSDVAGEATGAFGPGEEAVLSIQHEMIFATGRIFASVRVARRRRETLDRRPQMASLIVLGAGPTEGLIALPHEVALEARGGVLEGRSEA